MCFIVEAAFRLRKGSFFVWKQCRINLNIHTKVVAFI